MADGVYQVNKGSRSYVVDGDEGVTLIDTGLPGRGGAVVAAIESIGRTVDDVRAILLTHSHVDHTGSAAYLKRESGAELYCSAKDAPAVRGTERPSAPPILDRTPLQILKPLLGLLPSSDSAVVDHEIGEGVVLRLPEDLTATATAGHTPGHTSYLLDRAGGILFVGDAASQRRGRVSRGWFNRPTPAADRSLQIIAGLEFSTACFGHADPITGGASDAFKRFAARL